MASDVTSRTEKASKNSFTGIIQKLVSLLLPFVVRTVLIKKLGIEYLGLNILFSSILQVLSLSELGFATAITFNLYKPIAENNHEKICALLNVIKKIYHIVGLVILVVGLAIMPFLPHLIEGSYPSDVNLYLLYLIFLFNTVISYFLSAHMGVVLNAYQRSDIENIIFLICNSLYCGLQIAVLFISTNYYLYIILLPLSTIVINIVRAIVVNKKYPNLKPCGTINRETKKEISQQVKSLIGHKISGIVVSSTDSIIVSAFLGLGVLAIYNNYFYVMSAIMAIINVVYVSITASIGDSIISSDQEKIYKDFKTINFANVWLVGWCSICLLCLYQHFMRLWVGVDLMLPFFTVILLVVYFYTWKFRDMVNVYKDATGNWTMDFWKPYVVAISNIVLDLILINYLGVNGVLWATIISVPVISFPWEVAVMFKHVFKRSPLMYCVKMLLYTLVTMGTGALTYFVCELLPNEGILNFIYKGLICLILPNIIFFASSFYLDEFKHAKSKVFFIVKKVFHKDKNIH